ncbi:unnamed protein product [Schistocephalus solidus]|uniref:Uncharacterized protein n=1 Tax=Schistocephalus solidus TaxID=70667 RepID=A0A3P7F4H4_SCHSO|nr:unnamed protein product [Schistocephalus solidus]
MTDRIFRVSNAVCQPPLVSTVNNQNCPFPARLPSCLSAAVASPSLSCIFVLCGVNAVASLWCILVIGFAHARPCCSQACDISAVVTNVPPPLSTLTYDIEALPDRSVPLQLDGCGREEEARPIMHECLPRGNPIYTIKGIDSCSFPCRRPLFRPEEYSLARNLTFCASIVGIVLNLFVLVRLATLIVLPTTFTLLFSRNGLSTTISINSSSQRPVCHLLHHADLNPLTGPLPSSTVGPTCCHHHQEIDGAAIPCTVGGFYRLPHTALFFIHLAFLFGCIGWLLPHLPAVGDRIACRPDGSIRVGEPKHITGEEPAGGRSTELRHLPTYVVCTGERQQISPSDYEGRACVQTDLAATMTAVQVIRVRQWSAVEKRKPILGQQASRDL